MQSLDKDSARLVWEWRGHWYSLPISAEDMVTLAQAVDMEGYPREGVAWALLQRAAWVRSHGVEVRLGKLVEQYAQPINPAWFPDGAKHLGEIARLGRLGDYAGVEAEKAKAAARPGKVKPWTAISSETKEVIGGVLAGQSSPVVGAVHYWASRGPDFAANQAKRPGLVLLDRGYGFGPGRNVFFAEPGSERFAVAVQNGYKAMPGGGGAPPPATPTSPPISMAGMGPGPVVIGLMIGYWAWKWFR